MPGPTRRALGAVVALLGITAAGLGAWTAVKLGPSGEARFTASAKATGAIVIQQDVLNSVDVPVRVRATRDDGGEVWLALAPSSDAGAVVATAAVSTVSGVHYPAGRLDLRLSGSGALPDLSTADVWRSTSKRAASAEIVVAQGRGPESVVVTSGDGSALKNVTVTLTFAERSWFFEALAAAVIGAIIAAFALGDLMNTRPAARRGDGVRSRRTRAMT